MADDPDLRPRESRPDRSYLRLEEIATVISAAGQIEAEHRGLSWEDVELIRTSDQSGVALARKLRVSDVLIGKVRRGEL